VDRFWNKVDRTETQTQCWIFKGYLNKFGYGVFRAANGTTQLAHRFAWSLENGSLRSDATLHHLCGTRNCVRPSHLQLMSSSENIGRANSSRYAERFKCGHLNIDSNRHGLGGGCQQCWNTKRRERRRLYGRE
jgi:hypothetical protein